jgi:hypothetical protein
MRNEAQVWVKDMLELSFQWNAAGLQDIHNTWGSFQRAFKEMWFSVNASSDLMVNWTNLRQLNGQW